MLCLKPSGLCFLIFLSCESVPAHFGDAPVVRRSRSKGSGGNGTLALLSSASICLAGTQPCHLAHQQHPAPAFQPCLGLFWQTRCLREQQALSEETWGIPTGKEDNSYPPGSYGMCFTCQWQPKTWSPVSEVKQASLKSMPWQTKSQGFEDILGQYRPRPWAETMSPLPCSGKSGVWSKWSASSPDPIAHAWQFLGCIVPREGSRKGKVQLCPAVTYERQVMTKSFFPQSMPYNNFYKINSNCIV